MASTSDNSTGTGSLGVEIVLRLCGTDIACNPTIPSTALSRFELGYAKLVRNQRSMGHAARGARLSALINDLLGYALTPAGLLLLGQLQAADDLAVRKEIQAAACALAAEYRAKCKDGDL